MTLLKRVTS